MNELLHIVGCSSQDSGYLRGQCLYYSVLMPDLRLTNPRVKGGISICLPSDSGPIQITLLGSRTRWFHNTLGKTSSLHPIEARRVRSITYSSHVRCLSLLGRIISGSPQTGLQTTSRVKHIRCNQLTYPVKVYRTIRRHALVTLLELK